MLNEFQFSFLSSEIEKLTKGSKQIIITGKVVFDQKKYSSTFKIFAEGSEPKSFMKVTGCPMPCRNPTPPPPPPAPQQLKSSKQKKS